MCQNLETMFSVLVNFLSLLSYVISHEMTVYGELDTVEEAVVLFQCHKKRTQQNLPRALPS